MAITAASPWTASAEPFVGRLEAIARDFTRLTGTPVDVATELFLRAELAGYRPPGRTSANGSCHLVPASDGWAAVNLARPDDAAALPALYALLGADVPDTEAPVAGLREAARERTADQVASAAQLLGTPAAGLGSVRDGSRAVYEVQHGERRVRGLSGLRVVDLSALWAGPLCARLLGQAGARVTKVESTTRPDGARRGSPAFYRRLHEGHESLVVDFASGALPAIVAEADVVIEASRPRALRRLGVVAEDFLAARPGRLWIGITGYGRDDDRVAFGDDAAVAGGLVGRDASGDPVFLGDAMADPVTGILAAHAAARALAEGGGRLVSVAMANCAAWLADGRADEVPRSPC
ncbi:CoA transferase [Streptodolium elevatio]|uniref:CoA transferase n=1 Tax=Streptodolium elevatio TaxID=3157996 RepID=A0ABV3DTP2_9ACTN